MRRITRQQLSATTRTLTNTFPSLPDHLNSTSMSDKIKEFIEVPQQFIRDGNQVGLCNFEAERMSRTYILWFAVLDTVHKTHSKRSDILDIGIGGL